MIAYLSVDAGLFETNLHPDCIVVDRTGLELALGDELPEHVFGVRSFKEHMFKGPFR